MSPRSRDGDVLNWREMDVARTEKQSTKLLSVRLSDRSSTRREVKTMRWAPRICSQQRNIFFISAAYPLLDKSTTSPENDGRVSDEVVGAIVASTSKILRTLEPTMAMDACWALPTVLSKPVSGGGGGVGKTVHVDLGIKHCPRSSHERFGLVLHIDNRLSSVTHIHALDEVEQSRTPLQGTLRDAQKMWKGRCVLKYGTIHVTSESQWTCTDNVEKLGEVKMEGST
ncbi:hypothetical protein ARMSODRAFT_983189 [Armillaria solidipes]|uniref:Uncharacterized protein n=1 Tax=Armillaria solidipes TaxID=1076256 RepID=A0A2H3AWK8_9AGAR|nr:hypothetical protein ARMSODRAFT_983189 [Armillaria solidipes]